MPKRNASAHSTTYADKYADEQLDDSKQSEYAADHPKDDWRQTDFAHRFTDELKSINDSAAANFDSGKKLTDYSSKEREQLAYATAEAFRSMDFESNQAKVESARNLSHTLMGPIAEDIRLEEAQLQPKDIDLLKRAGVNHVLSLSQDPSDPEMRVYEFTVNNAETARAIAKATGAEIVESTAAAEDFTTSHTARYIDIFADRFALELLSDPATHENDAVGHSLQDILDQAVSFAKDTGAADSKVTSYANIAKEEDPYAMDILLDLAAQEPMQDIRRELFVLQHTSPDAATAAHTATDAIAALYKDQLQAAVTSGTQDQFDMVTDHMNDFAETFANAAKGSANFANGEDYKPELPDSFPNPQAAIEYIDSIKNALDDARTADGNIDPTVDSAITKLTEEFQRVNATYSHNLDPNGLSTNATDWQAMLNQNTAFDNESEEDRAAAEAFYQEYAGLDPISLNSNLSSDQSAAKEDHYRLHRIAAGIDYLMNFAHNVTTPATRQPAPVPA